MDKTIKTLQAIERSITECTLKADKPMLMVNLSEAVLEVRESTTTIPYSYSVSQANALAYSNMIKQYKNKVLCDLHDIQHELSKKNSNKGMILRRIEILLKTELYMIYVRESINRFVAKNARYNQEILSVKGCI